MTAYALVIDQKVSTLEHIMEYLKIDYKSKDYMDGFLDGTLFDNYRLYTLSEYQEKVRIQSPSLKDTWLVFVYVTPEPEEEY